MSIRSLLLPAIMAASLAAPAFAQAPAATPATASTPSPAVKRHDAMVEHRITELRTKLKITPAQQKPFDDFAQAMRDNATRMDDVITQHKPGADVSAVEQLKTYAALSQSHAEEVGRLVGPFSALYDALSSEQKKLADQSFRDFSHGPKAGRALQG